MKAAYRIEHERIVEIGTILVDSEQQRNRTWQSTNANNWLSCFFEKEQSQVVFSVKILNQNTNKD
jgi:hypothetical protein